MEYRADEKKGLPEWAQLDAWQRGWATLSVAWLSKNQNDLPEDEALKRFDKVVQEHIAQIVANPKVKAVFMKRLEQKPLDGLEQELYDQTLWSDIYKGVPPSQPRHIHENEVLERVRRIVEEVARSN